MKPAINPEFLVRWERSLKDLVAARWGQLYPAVLAGQADHVELVIADHYAGLAQRCSSHPLRRFHTRDGVRLVFDVYRFLFEQFKLHRDSVESFNPVGAVLNVFPTLSASCGHPLAHGAQACPTRAMDAYAWIETYWRSLGELELPRELAQGQVSSPRLGGRLGVPVLICEHCGSTPFGFDQTDVLGQGYEGGAEVLMACRVHVKHLLRIGRAAFSAAAAGSLRSGANG